MYFLVNADLSKFDSQYYDIRYIHSLLLNSGPWTETGTIKTTLNIKQNKASEQKALNIIPAPMWLTPPPPCPPTSLSTTSLFTTSLTTTTRLVVLKSKKTELCPKYFSIPEHVVQHSELKWLLNKSYWIFLNAFLTVRPLDSLLHFGIQLINIKY